MKLCDKAPALDFSVPGEMRVNGHRFVIDLSRGDKRGRSNDDSFLLVKPRNHLEIYKKLWERLPRSILEVGFFEGGSSVFLDTFFSPQQLSCVDIRKGPIEAVEQYIQNEGRRDCFRMVYETDQTDAEALLDLVDSHHNGQLDFVIDDASHQYTQTLATFQALFPKVVPGGIYVLEDYGWAHHPNFQALDHPWRNLESMSKLVFELTMLLSGSSDSTSGIISQIDLHPGVALVHRGAAPCPQDFKIADLYLNRGREFPDT